MSRIRLSLAEVRQSNRKYTKANREDWADLGFRSVTLMVHNDERSLVLAEMDLRKADAMVAIAESKNTSSDLMLLLSRRNMAALPSPGDLASIKQEASKSEAKAEVAVMLDIVQNYVKRCHGIEANYAKATDEGKRINMMARAVAYSGACAAQLRLAKCVLERAPLKDKTIFGAKGTLDE